MRRRKHGNLQLIFFFPAYPDENLMSTGGPSLDISKLQKLDKVKTGTEILYTEATDSVLKEKTQVLYFTSDDMAIYISEQQVGLMSLFEKKYKSCKNLARCLARSCKTMHFSGRFLAGYTSSCKILARYTSRFVIFFQLGVLRKSNPFLETCPSPQSVSSMIHFRGFFSLRNFGYYLARACYETTYTVKWSSNGCLEAMCKT